MFLSFLHPFLPSFSSFMPPFLLPILTKYLQEMNGEAYEDEPGMDLISGSTAIQGKI